MLPWKVVDRVPTPQGALELRQRGEKDFLMTVGGRVLMTSVAHQSEDALARLTCDALAPIKNPRVLVGGLGMALTLRAALDRLPPGAQVTVVDLNERVVAWCRGPLAALTEHAVEDRRVRVQVANVAKVIAQARPRSYHAIMLDLYEGPPKEDGRRVDPLYGPGAIENVLAALEPGGIFAVWSEDESPPFQARLTAAGYLVARHRTGKGGRTHVVYLATAPTGNRRASR
ncbi:MAG TPA: spermidine synthase [Polyangia bacterium]|nr:spermidine synthase [Polyangia bacterium]